MKFEPNKQLTNRAMGEVVRDGLQSFVGGIAGYGRGVAWLVARPSVFIMLLIPLVSALLAFGVAMWAFFQYGNDWVSGLLLGWFSSWSDAPWFELFYQFCKFTAWVSAFVVCVAIALATSAFVSAPIYELISMRVERELLGESSYKISLPRMMKVMVGEALKGVVIVTVPLVMMLIPGVNLLALAVMAFLYGWDFYDFPLARRGWTFSERWAFVRSEFWTVMGFGVLLTVPLLQIFLVPMAVAGGTILNIEALRRKGLVGGDAQSR